MRVVKQRRARGEHGDRRGGFTLVEIGLAMTVLMIALMAMSASTLRMNSLRRQNRERAIAQNMIRAISEQVHATADRLRRTSNDWSGDFVSALADGGSMGNTFSVGELTPRTEQPTVGTIELVVDETATDDELGFELGMPRDLDGDGAIDNADVSATARLFPVVVRTRWTGVSGDVEIVHPFYVIGY